MFACLVMGVWLFYNFLAPFVLGLFFAYMGLPFVRRFEQWKWPRSLGICLYLCIISVGLLGLFFLLVPMLIQPLVQAWKGLASSQKTIKSLLIMFKVKDSWISSIPMAQTLLDTALNVLQDSLMTLAQWGLALMRRSVALGSVILWTCLTPMISFYFLKDWPEIQQAFWHSIPRRFRRDMSDFMTDIDLRLRGYLQGQWRVCIVLSCYYGLVFSLLQLQSGLILGALTGCLVFVPYMGIAISFVVVTMTHIFSVGGQSTFPPIFMAFLGGQALESLYLTPIWIGNRVRLHPLTVLFFVLMCSMSGSTLIVIFSVPIAIIVTAVLRKSIAPSQDEGQ